MWCPLFACSAHRQCPPRVPYKSSGAQPSRILFSMMIGFSQIEHHLGALHSQECVAGPRICLQSHEVLNHAGTTAGQDLNLSLDRVLGNRNLTNKLWNAGKFLQMQLGSCSDAELAELAAADFSSADSLTDLPLVERWVLSALHQV